MKTIYLTVDTECHEIAKANQYLYGKIGAQEYGIKKILELATELNIPVNFFLDVVECRKYGDKYVSDIVSLIRSYGQPIFLHLHPNYVSEDSRSYLWEYTDEEKISILLAGIDDYSRLVGVTDGIVFRAGRYGVNRAVYDALSETGKISLDLSYCCHDMKMCRLPPEEAKNNNAPFQINGISVLPNTRYIGLSLLGKQKCFNLDAADSTKDEFCSFIKRTSLNNIVWTMHSWNFIKKWFFLKDYIRGNDYEVEKFKQCVNIARKAGFEFGNLQQYSYKEEHDELVNLCEGVSGKFRCILNNFIRFRKIGRLTKKYFILYHVFYCIALLLLVLLLCLVLL